VEKLRFRIATEWDIDRVAEIIHGSPGPEAVALVGGEERARRFGFAITRLQAKGRGWRRTILAEVGGRPVAVLQWRLGSEPALTLSCQLAWATISALGPFGAASAWRRNQVRQRVNPSPPASAFHVEELHVLPSFRDRGIGGSLLGHAEEVALSEGFRQISLITNSENRAQRLYRRAGFEEVDRREDPAYKRLTGIAGRILMAKCLAAPNKPLQPTRAAQPNGQREPAGSGPRG
jgi:ribosomal protein S18 acetylase RimI-like enzyme